VSDEQRRGHGVQGEDAEGDKLDAVLRREAQGYRSGDRPPADVMWARIERDVARAIQPRERRIVRYWAWLASVAGIAAALVLGVAIGRRSAPTGTPASNPPSVAVAPSVPATSADSARNAQLRAATLNHLVQAEVFLTEVRADLKTGRHDPQRTERSRHLLARTRLLMANGAGGAPAVDRLLQDLELVLAEIAALPDSGARRSMDARLLDERLRVGTVLPRIRTILPSAASRGGDDDF
jgi:hypothetical protein